MKHADGWFSQQTYSRHHRALNGLGVCFIPVDDPFQLPRWLWWVLASSPLVLIVIGLALAVAVLLVVLWRRSRRQPPPDTQPAAPAPAPAEAPPPTADFAATQTAPHGYSAEHAKTQPSPAVRPAPETVILTPTQSTQTMPVSGQRPASIHWQIAGLTDVGLKRELNEDSFLMAETVAADGVPLGLYVVADGLGGHQSGEIASRLTVDAIYELFLKESPASGEAPHDDWLSAAANTANRAVLARQEHPEQVKKMGSTLVMALVGPQYACIANVGDSRAYHLHGDTITQVSVDHSLVERLVQIGQLTREEARTHKNRNVVYNTIGDRQEIEVGLYHITLEPGDRLLLCSDGLSGMLNDRDILAISRRQANPADACQIMVKAAKAAGGTDNITVVMVQMDAV